MLLRTISLGAGVQSTTMALMAAHGEIRPMPDCAIFADTGWEPRKVYEHLEWLETRLPFPVHRTRRKGPDLGEHVIRICREPVTRTASPPFFTKDPDGFLPRQCSKEFKVRPIGQKVREILGLQPGQRGPSKVVVEQWIGISTDEASRMKPAEQSFIANRWPLVEQGMSRWDCLRWLERNGYPRPPKSACIFCPYHDQAAWRDMKLNHPEEWAKAVAFDEAIRPGFYGMQGTAYLHKQRVPLSEVDVSNAEDRGQLNMFNDECEGMCGV